MLVFWGVPFNVNFTMPTWSRKWAGLAASGEKNISATNMKQTLEPKKTFVQGGPLPVISGVMGPP